jgi:hypothetical protein
LEFSDNEEENDELKAGMRKKKSKISFLKFDSADPNEFESASEADDDDDDRREVLDEALDNEKNNNRDENENYFSDDEENPLLADLLDKKESKKDLWFKKDAFDFLNNQDEQNNELLDSLDLDEEPSRTNDGGKKETKNHKKSNVAMDEATSFINGNTNGALDKENLDDNKPLDEKKSKIIINKPPKPHDLTLIH